MNCADIQELLTSYLLSDLDPAQSAEVRAHLQTCAACRASADELQATLLLLREGLADTSSLPSRLPEKFMLQFQKRRWRRPRLAKTKPAPRRLEIHLVQWAAAAAILVLLAGLMLPNLSSTRERARRVNDLSNLNGVYKSAAAWGLDPKDPDRPAFPQSLDQLVKEAHLPPEMLVSTETKEPIEYYPDAKDTDWDRPLLVSHGKGGRNVVRVAGSGMWVEDGTPQAEALDKQLAGLPKQVAAAAKDLSELSYKDGGPPATFFDYWSSGSSDGIFGFLRPSPKTVKQESFEGTDALMCVPPPPAMQTATIQGEQDEAVREVSYKRHVKAAAGKYLETMTSDEKTGQSVADIPSVTLALKDAKEKGEARSSEPVAAAATPVSAESPVIPTGKGAGKRHEAERSKAHIKLAMAREGNKAGHDLTDSETREGRDEFGSITADYAGRKVQPPVASEDRAPARNAAHNAAGGRSARSTLRQPGAGAAPSGEGRGGDKSGAAGDRADKPAAESATTFINVSGSASSMIPIKSGYTPPAAPTVQLTEAELETDLSSKISAANVARLQKVKKFQSTWGVTGETKTTRAKLLLFKAKYQDGDWDCNPEALSNLSFQIRALSKDRIDITMTPEVMDIGTDRLFTIKPPFVYLTGSQGITFQDNEIRNMRDYLMLGGAVWVDSASPGKGNVFDISVRREMKRVFPDRDFEIVPSEHELFNAHFDGIGLPPGWGNSKEPVEMINIGKELAVLYTLNNYGKLWTYRLDKDGHIDYTLSPKKTGADALLATGSAAPDGMVTDLSVVNAYKFGFNVVHHLLTRYQKYFKFLPVTRPVKDPATNAVPPPEPAASNAPPVNVPVCQATGVNPFVSAADKPFSTFSIDVDTASYTLSRNYLLRGLLPPPEAVRTEEFVNYFDYDYTPPAGSTFAVYTDCGPSAFGRGLSLLKIGVKGRRLGREEKRPAVLTLLIDTSGSMATPDRIELVKSALSQMVERLDKADRVAIVQYDSHARLLLEHTPASDKKKILAVIEGLQTSGSTSLEEGMREAYATAARGFNSGGCNRVLLLSDGMANLGSTAAEDILKSIESYRKQGITLSVFGFGLGAYNDVMLETLANKGDGVYAFIDSEAEAKRALVDDLAATVNLIARDVKIQVEFNPKRVKQYRQLGYENRQLKKEQFRDDSVDAGEIGSGQSVTALYELELQGDGREPLGMVRVRCRNALTGQIEEIEQPILPPAGVTPFEAMDVRFRLAAAAAEFSEILRGSPFAAGRRFEDVARVLRPVALELSLDNRIQEFLRLTQTGLTPKFQEAETP